MASILSYLFVLASFLMQIRVSGTSTTVEPSEGLKNTISVEEDYPDYPMCCYEGWQNHPRADRSLYCDPIGEYTEARLPCRDWPPGKWQLVDHPYD